MSNINYQPLKCDKYDNYQWYMYANMCLDIIWRLMWKLC